MSLVTYFGGSNSIMGRCTNVSNKIPINYQRFSCENQYMNENFATIDSNQLFSYPILKANTNWKISTPEISTINTIMPISLQLNLNELAMHLSQNFCVCDEMCMQIGNCALGINNNPIQQKFCKFSINSISASKSVEADIDNEVIKTKIYNADEVNAGSSKSLLNKPVDIIGKRKHSAFSQYSSNDEQKNAASDVEEIIQTSIPNQELENDEYKERSKRRLYHLRQDVIAKIIFRSFRKYYMKEFKSFFDFSKCRRDSNSDTQGELLRKINSYIENNFRSIEYEYLGIFLLAVIDIKDKFINFLQ